METGRKAIHYALGDNQDYECEWSKAVLEYLENGYSSEDSKSEVEVGDTTYKILKREKVTAFYDADGNTLFDIENGRLKEEYEAIDFSETEPQSEIGKAIAGIEKQAYTEAINNEAQKVSENSSWEEKKDNESTEKGIDEAVKKLQGELKSAKEGYAEPILSHMIDRCKESETLADAVCQTHKTWEKCFKYIMDQARKLKSGNCAMVKDSVVYEWAEDYYRLDDKALEEKKTKEAKEREKKQKADQQKRLDGMKKRAEKKAKAVEKDKVAKEAPKPETKLEAKVDKPKKEPEKKEAPKKRSNELEGQMDLFSMMGL